MIKGVLLLTASWFSATALAGSLSVSKQGVVERPAEEVLSVLTDYENTCDSGCTYYVKGLKETQVVSLTETKHVIWQFIEATRNTKQFVVNTISRDEDGSILFISRYPSVEEIATLEQETGLKHESLFSKMDTDWLLTPSEGVTQAEAVIEVEHGLPDFANGIIRNALKN